MTVFSGRQPNGPCGLSSPGVAWRFCRPHRGMPFVGGLPVWPQHRQKWLSCIGVPRFIPCCCGVAVVRFPPYWWRPEPLARVAQACWCHFSRPDVGAGQWWAGWHGLGRGACPRQSRHVGIAPSATMCCCVTVVSMVFLLVPGLYFQACLPVLCFAVEASRNLLAARRLGFCAVWRCRMGRSACRFGLF